MTTAFLGMPTRVEVAESSRFQSVTAAWRKKLRRERFLVIEAVTGIGFHVQTPTEQLVSGVKDFGKSARGMGRAFRKVSEVAPEALSGPKRAEQDHIRNVMVGALDAVNRSRRTLIKPPSAVQVAVSSIPER